MKRVYASLRYAFICLTTLIWVGDLHAQNGPWKINVKDVEIASFIEEVATITGKTFVVDPRVKGTASIISDTELSQEGVYDLLLSVLKIQEFSVIESGDIVEVIQSSRARTLGGAKVEADDDVSGDLWVTHVLDAGHLDPSEIVKSLRQLAPQHAQFSAIAESNAVLISDRKNNVDAMLRVVEQLKSSAIQKTVLVNLEHTLNTEVAELLTTILDDDESLNIIGNNRNNTLLLRGSETALMGALQSIDLIDQPSENEANTRVFRLGQGIAKEVAAIVSGIVEGPARADSSSIGDSAPRIVADESLNAVVVRANPASMERIANLIEDLDQRRTQVLIEAAIVEVDLTDVSSSGVELSAADEDGNSVPAFSTSLNGVLSALITRLGANSASDGGVNPAEVIGAFSSPTIAISQLDPDGLSFGAIINALTTTTFANLLSTPSVVALNNEESRILVGQNVPFRSGNLIFPNEQSLSGIRPTSRNDIGTELTVTPSIHEDLSVRMNINATIEVILQDTALGIGDAGLADIVTNKRELVTVVVAENRQTIVLGGLIRNETRVTDRRVPVLGRIPLLGRLFRSESQTNGRTMLLIFLRPTVMVDAQDTRTVTDRKFQEYWEVTIEGKDSTQPDIDDLFKGGTN